MELRTEKTRIRFIDSRSNSLTNPAPGQVLILFPVSLLGTQAIHITGSAGDLSFVLEVRKALFSRLVCLLINCDQSGKMAGENKVEVRGARKRCSLGVFAVSG